MNEMTNTSNTQIALLGAFKKLCNCYDSNLDDVTSEVLKTVSLVFPIKGGAIFQKTQDSLDFTLINGFGNNNWYDIYQAFLDDGAIGIVLANCIYNLAEISEKKYNLIPIFNDTEIFGLIIIEYESEKITALSSFIDFLNIISNYLSYKISNLQLKNKIIELEKNMNLHIASRTMNLLKNYQQLSEKIKNLYKSLSMSLPHEFRTPLNQILGNSDFLMKHYDDTAPEEAKEIISDIHISCRRLQTLIEHYLVLSQLELIAINIDQLEEIKSSRTPSIEASTYSVLSSKIQFDNRADDFRIELEDASIQMPENFFTILMTELIDNAVKYSEAGKPIYVKTKSESDNIVLTIYDSGKGFSKEDLEKIDAYTQFDRDKFEQQGLGLGLAIVMRIIDICNCKIDIESRQNEFTKFEIRIPIAKISEY